MSYNRRHNGVHVTHQEPSQNELASFMSSQIPCQKSETSLNETKLRPTAELDTARAPIFQCLRPPAECVRREPVGEDLQVEISINIERVQLCGRRILAVYPGHTCPMYSVPSGFLMNTSLRKKTSVISGCERRALTARCPCGKGHTRDDVNFSL